MNIKCTHTHTCTWYSAGSLTQKHSPDDQYEEGRVLYPALFVWNWESHSSLTDDSKLKPEVWFYIRSVWRNCSPNLLYWRLNHKEEISLIATLQKWIKHQCFMDLKHAVAYCIKISVLIMLENWNVILLNIYILPVLYTYIPNVINITYVLFSKWHPVIRPTKIFLLNPISWKNLL